jgi:ATP-dependent Clp protease ATP-binding subunit ClpA
MQTLRNPLVWQGLIAAVLLIGLISNQPMIAALVPFGVAAALLYIGWRVAGVLLVRPPTRVTSSAPDRTPLRTPEIMGDVSGTAVDQPIDPTDMTAYLTSRVIGQELVAQQLARGIYRRAAQERRGKPVFTAMLSGPTGTGKTEMAKAIADYLFGGGAGLFRVDCANVLGEAGLQTLIGSPKGFAGSSSWGTLTAHLRATPHTVLLFDEIEKAVTSPTAPMAKLLLSLLDEGVCTEQSDGTRVSATDAVIIMTSNAAQERLGQIHQQFRGQPDQLIRATKDTLRDVFAPEFLARIDLVTALAPLSQEARAQIVALQLGRIAASYGVEVEQVDASFVNQALRLWTTLAGYGTREVVRWVEQAVADQLIHGKRQGVTRVRVSWADDQAVVEPA